MKRLLAAVLAVLVLAFGLPTAAGHDIGAMRVELVPGLEGLVRVEVLVDLDHVPSAVRGDFARSLAGASWVLVGERRAALGEPASDEAVLENGKPTSKRRLAFDVEVGPGVESVGWLTTLDMPEYLLEVGVGEGRPTQWLTGGQASERYALAGLLERRADASVFAQYLGLGFTHIIPYGTDHVLFVLVLFLASTRMGPLLKQVTAFTVAHTLTLALTMLDVVHVPSSIVEPMIAASIVVLAVENLIAKDVRPRRVGLVFLFGLLHGMGFAGVLAELGLPRSQFVPALVGFNVGVEGGQLAVLAGAFAAVGVWGRRKGWYRGWVVAPGSVALGLVAAFWTAQRVGIFP